MIGWFGEEPRKIIPREEQVLREKRLIEFEDQKETRVTKAEEAKRRETGRQWESGKETQGLYFMLQAMGTQSRNPKITLAASGGKWIAER